MKLYGADVCPFVHRARLALAEKNLKHEYVAIDLANKPEWYHQVLPSGKVPLLEHDGQRVWESAIVCEYLEDAFPQRPLLPEGAGHRAQARLWIDWASNSLVPNFYKLLRAEASEEQGPAREALLKDLQKLEQEGFQESEWIYGDSLSLVDLETYPWFERWCVLEHYRDFAVPENFEKIHRWTNLMKQRNSVKEIAQTPDYYIGLYERYAASAATASR